MVKRKLCLPFACAAACAVVLVGCSAVRQVIDVRPESITLASGPLGSAVSLAAGSSTLIAVYSDPATTTIDEAQIPIAPHLPDQTPSRGVIDKIDTAPPLAAGFGRHVLAVNNDRVSILYEDRRTDTKTVLKVASRRLVEDQWRLDVLEPAGDPVALLPASRDDVAAFWSTDALLTRSMVTSGAADVVYSPFHLAWRPSIAGPDAFTAFDTLSACVVAVSRSGDGWAAIPVRGTGAVHASLLSVKGQLSVLSWDERSRRLLLHEQKERSREFGQTTVTLSNATSSVALLPGPSPSTYLFVFDEMRAGKVGNATYQVSLIAPGPVLGAIGGRYRKAVLCSGEKPVQCISALVAGKSLYVLVLQGDLKLLRLDLKE